MSEDAVVIIFDSQTGRWLYIHDRWGKYDIIDAVKEGLHETKNYFGGFREESDYISFIIYEMIKNRKGRCEQIKVGVLHKTYNDIMDKVDTIGGKDVYSGEGEILPILEWGAIRIKDLEGNYILRETKFEDFINL
jgi:hypothetical protein